MKTKVLSLVVVFMMGSFSLIAGNKIQKFEVKGNCGMCEKRIENAALSIDGVSKAEWDKKTKQIEVTFDDTKTDIHKIHMAISKVGHDTDQHHASTEVYDKLPDCCKYDRNKHKKDVDSKHEH